MVVNRLIKGFNFAIRSVQAAISGLEDPADWLKGAFRLYGIDTGVPVNEKSIQQIPAFVSGVRLLSESIGSLSIKLQRETESTIRTEKNHPSYYLVCKKPSQMMTRPVFWETVMRYCILRGNAFAVIVRDGNAAPVELILVHESLTVEVIEQNNRLYYRVTGITDVLSSDDVLHFKGLGDGRIGIGCVEYAASTAGITLASQKNQAKFYKGGSQLDGVLEHPKQLSKEAATRLRVSWHDTYHSNDPKARVAVLEEGMQFKPISISPEAAKYLETLKHGYYDIAAILRVPPHMIALLDKSSFNNIEHQGLEYTKYSLLPWIVRFEYELWDKLLTEDEKRSDELHFKFNMEVLQRGDFKTRFEGYRVAINSGIYSQNDVLRLEGKEPFEGGDRRWIQMNMMPLDKADEVIDKQGLKNQGNERD